jgi:hypothetical protein
VREAFIQPGHLCLADHPMGRDRQFPAQIEQVVLDLHQVRANRVRKPLDQQHTDRRVQLVDFTDHLDPGVVLVRARAVAQPGRAVVAGAGGNC